MTAELVMARFDGGLLRGVKQRIPVDQNWHDGRPAAYQVRIMAYSYINDRSDDTCYGSRWYRPTRFEIGGGDIWVMEEDPEKSSPKYSVQ